MKLTLKSYDALCETEIFIINGINADSNDFGSKSDEDTENAEDYGCGNMQFIRTGATDFILKKYNITKSEYEEVASKLEELLSFGRCGWCV